MKNLESSKGQSMIYYTESAKKRMTLRQKQSLFVLMVAKLIEYSYDIGYELTFGEAMRMQATANANAKSGKGIKNSLHTIRLAIDFMLFKDGVYLTKSEDHKLLGVFWESMGGSWGGRFGDGNHYSLEHNGVK